MKPSQRIEEIFNSLDKELHGVRFDHAIIQYLDEQYEALHTKLPAQADMV